MGVRVCEAVALCVDVALWEDDWLAEEDCDGDSELLEVAVCEPVRVSVRLCVWLGERVRVLVCV